MRIDRRALLLGSLATVCIRPDFACAGGAADDIRFIAAARHSDDRFAIVMLTADGRAVREIPLSARGHDIALHAKTGRAVAFARRPGTFAVAFETRSTREPIIFEAAAGRHFFGHGAFSTDGRLLYVTENDIASGAGRIGIYDVERGYRKIGEHASYGVGPHEVILLQDGKTLAVANGGLDTTPDAGRENLNVEVMDASLTFVDATSGALISKHELDETVRKLSIRHLAGDCAGRVWFGGQWQGALSDAPPLIGFAAKDQTLTFAGNSASLAPDLKGYIGSVASALDGRIIAASAPKAGRVIYIDAATSRIVGDSPLKDACGIAGEDDGTFSVTSGFGVLRHEQPQGSVLSEVQLADIAFDNHLRRLG